MATLRSKNLIFISAAPGGLGEYLASLVQWAIVGGQPADLYGPLKTTRKPEQLLWHSYQEYSLAHNLTLTNINSIIDDNIVNFIKLYPNLDLADLDYSQTNKIVLASRFSAATLAELFPNATIIDIKNTSRDCKQLAYNFITKELQGDLELAIPNDIATVENMFGEQDWESMLSDPLHKDSLEMQFLVGVVQSSIEKTSLSNADWNGSSLEYADFGSLPPNKETIIHALGVLEQATGPWQSPVVEVAELWVNFMNGVAVEPTL